MENIIFCAVFLIIKLKKSFNGQDDNSGKKVNEWKVPTITKNQ